MLITCTGPETRDTAPTALAKLTGRFQLQSAAWQAYTSHSYACIHSVTCHSSPFRQTGYHSRSLFLQRLADRNLVYAFTHAQLAPPLSHRSPAVSNSDTHMPRLMSSAAPQLCSRMPISNGMRRQPAGTPLPIHEKPALGRQLVQRQTLLAAAQHLPRQGHLRSGGTFTSN